MSEWPDAFVRGVNLACQYCFQEQAWICPIGNQVTTKPTQFCRCCWVLFFYTSTKQVTINSQFLQPWWN